MARFLLFVLLLIAAVPARPVAAQASGTGGLPPRPAPFRFVNDQANLLAPADAKKLESGLRRYADNTGTQMVVVTVPTLGGRDVADYGRALGTAWGVGQRGKNNGVVVLIGAQEHKVTIQAGSGLKSTITPELTGRVITQEMTPGFKQGNYFAGLRAGLNTLMLAANPSSNPRTQRPGAPAQPAPAATGLANASPTDNATPTPQPMTAVPAAVAQPVDAAPSGPGLGTLLVGALVVGGILWLLVRLFRRGSGTAPVGQGTTGSATPNFYPNQPNGPAGGYGAPGGYGGMAPNQGSGGMGVGGMLATGAAAAAGAYLGNRMASGHETTGSGFANDGPAPDHAGGAAAGAGAAGTGAAGDYFASRNAGADASGPDYFSSGDAAGNSSADYFSSDDNSTSYDDTSSDDTGGGGFDDNGNSGSW